MSSASSSVMTSIADHLLRFSADNTRVSTLLTLCVGRVLLNASRRGEDWQRLVRDEEIAHIVDWLKAAVVNDSPWLDNTDDKGRPKKLMKFSSIAAITAEVNRDMLRAARSGSAKPLIEGDEALHADLGDGYSLVRLLTPAALDRESAQMQHCIGNGAYDDQLGSDDHLFLSLRDPRGKPHATLEIKRSRIGKLKGKQNNPPVKRYVDRIVPFIQARQYEVCIPVYHLGYVIDVHGKWHAIDNLPDGLTVGGSLSLSGTPITALPKGLTVGGHLILRGTSITALPERLTVRGNLDLSGTPITELPKGLTVGGHLSLQGTSITALPEGLKVGGGLFLLGTSITYLPEGLTVGGGLFLLGTSITELPKGLTVGGHLSLSGTSITELPKGLKVGGHLGLQGTSITELPKGLTVGGNLNLRGTSITALPKGLRVGGNLSLSDTPITYLPEGLTVGGNLNLRGTRIADLPDSVSDDVTVYSDAGVMSASEFRSLNGRALERKAF